MHPNLSVFRFLSVKVPVGTQQEYCVPRNFVDIFRAGGEAGAENPRLVLSVLCCGARVSQINKSHQIPFPFCSQLRELSILSDLDHLLLQHESRAGAVLRTDVFLGTF